MATEWYCRIMDEVWGPMSAEELTLVARRGRLTRDDMVRRGEKGTWVRAEIVAGLFNADPLPPSASSRCLSLEPSRMAGGQGEGAFVSSVARGPRSGAAASATRPVPARRSIAAGPTIQTKNCPVQTPAAPLRARYWISDGHHTAGPFTSTQIRQLATHGTLEPNHLLRSDRSRWVLARRVQGLTFRRPMPLPPGRIPLSLAGANPTDLAPALMNAS